MRFTEEQQRVIRAGRGNLLLSAAAGSGKTTVMVERILRLVREEGARLDRMLVVTFTRAAASDMRAKLSASLDAQREHDLGLQLERASICTLHSFCADLLRTHFEAAGVDPAFRVLDEPVTAELRDAALDEALDAAYEAPSEALLALELGRGPRGVRALVEALCGRMAERPDPEAWLEQACGGPALEAAWCAELVRGAHRNLREALAVLRQAVGMPGCLEKYRTAMEQDILQLEAMLSLQEADALQRQLAVFRPAQVARGRNPSDTDEDAMNRVKDLREHAKARVAAAALRDMPIAQGLEDARAQEPLLRALSALALDTLRRLDEKKAELSGLSYGDLEHRALQALRDEGTRQAVRAGLDYVFVDEYQDISELQEEILSALCGPDNRFMVGDVKQSIYRFRQAEPALFTGYYDRYAQGDGGTLLPLTCNFRSDPAILRFVNRVFERVMGGGDAEILYDVLARLNPGDPDRPEGPLPEVHLLEKEGEPEPEKEIDQDIADLKDAEREGLFIARQIRQRMDADPSLRYRDFAILARSGAGVFTKLVPMLLAQGIPAYADSTGGYFGSLEILLSLSMLRLIANRRRDPELIGVLHSPVVGLNAQALAEIRLTDVQGSFSDAAWRAAWGAAYPERAAEAPGGETARRLREFFDRLERWRRLSGSVDLGELVRTVLLESGFYAYCAALPGGAQRRANLERLMERAGAFDRDISGSLVRFLSYADRMQARGEEESAHQLGENDDVVRLMTVHKSKGLEFRVVFGAQMGRRYRQNRAEGLSLHRRLGMGILRVDPRLRSRRRTLAQAAIAVREQQEDAAEEMRILYVLLTRARERLILVGSVREMARAEARWDSIGAAVSAARSHLDLVMSALRGAAAEGLADVAQVTVHGMDELSAQQVSPADPRALLEEIRQNPAAFADPALERQLAWTYPHPLDARKPLKLTASGLLRTLEGPQQLPELVRRPAFLSEEGASGMTGAERGTAYHRCMQLLRLEALRGLSGAALTQAVAGQMDDFALRRLLTEVQRTAVQPARIARFLESPVGQRMLAAQELHREWSFNVLMRASEALTEEEAGVFGGEELLVQGTIDCCFVENGRWILLDYKTDRADDPEALKAHYSRQLAVYALALERITGLPVAERLLCLLGAGTVLALENE